MSSVAGPVATHAFARLASKLVREQRAPAAIRFAHLLAVQPTPPALRFTPITSCGAHVTRSLLWYRDPMHDFA
jgi:hypothetical protein